MMYDSNMNQRECFFAMNQLNYIKKVDRNKLGLGSWLICIS